MLAIDTSDIAPRHKAAMVLIGLGVQTAAQVLSHLNEAEIEVLTAEIINVKQVPPEAHLAVLEEFLNLCRGQISLMQGGVDYARKVLQHALGESRGDQVIKSLVNSMEEKPFEFIKRTEPAEISGFLQNENPQTIALVLAHLSADQAATVISNLPPDLRADVAMRIAKMGRSSPEVVREVEKVLQRKLSTTVIGQQQAVGGLQSLVNIINNADRSTERAILEALEEDNPELADEIKKQLFVFEDIVRLDDRAIQSILREVDTKDLGMALKGASEDVKNKIFQNMSGRAAQMLKEDMEFMGPVRMRSVEEAQTRVMAAVRRLEEAGQIEISRGGEDALVV